MTSYRADQVGEQVREEIEVVDRVGVRHADVGPRALEPGEAAGGVPHGAQPSTLERAAQRGRDAALEVCNGADDQFTRNAAMRWRAIAALNDKASATAVGCERAFLARLDGSCKTPIAGLAEIDDGMLRFRGLILAPDGSEWHEIGLDGAAENAASIGTDAGEELLARAGPKFLASLA